MWTQFTILLSGGLLICEWSQTHKHTHTHTPTHGKALKCCGRMFAYSDLWFWPCSTWAGVQRCQSALSNLAMSSGYFVPNFERRGTIAKKASPCLSESLCNKILSTCQTSPFCGILAWHWKPRTSTIVFWV